MEGLWPTVLIIFLLVLVLVAAYYATKFIAKKGKKLTKSKHINVIDQIYLAVDKQIALIDVGGKTILVGITNQAINFITEFNEDEIILDQKDEKETISLSQDWPNRIAGLFKKMVGSQEALRKARTSLKQKVNRNKTVITSKEDEYDKMMKSINHRKKQYESTSRKGNEQ